MSKPDKSENRIPAPAQDIRERAPRGNDEMGGRVIARAPMKR